MDNQNEKLNDRLSFYMKAYAETMDELKLPESEKSKVEQEIDSESKNILDETIPDPLDNSRIDSLEKEYQMNLDDIVTKHEELKNKYIEEKESLQSDSRYKEYLNLIINDDLKLVEKMENDDVFDYLLNQKFGTVEFENEPCIIFIKFKYQPRFWKFKKIADKKANEFGIDSFEEMYHLWSGLRINYKSLVGNKKMSDVIGESELIEKRIKDLDVAINSYLTSRRQDIINTIIRRIKMVDVVAFDKTKFSNLIPLLEKYNGIAQHIRGLQNRKTVIMQNINTVEKMIILAEQGRFVLDKKSTDAFFNNTNPVTPIFEMITEAEWSSINKALVRKGIKTTSKDNYSVVRKTISEKEKKAILEKYNVKEGEIFIDSNLVSKTN
ncbi:hypothetical protein FRZ06_21445 [Anoxybacterium hadale]|uniref:Uncharacterized protein n=1 Tax=Anoxybacterium hadale TaxID=3408580 RepID=A0ACD1AH92_9FIRM|nr:hypothetical protein FRZ06_21445 [Clostridiales bacterium]